ncbi:hypothetical protein ABZZ74_48270 [Streptomyces sp. NPDC006476]|uniref:hypothetical protein n=1 Tax=Streptomyces sp. NPDC006476 TaxID=3157175 RepID=UPI0033B6C72A
MALAVMQRRGPGRPLRCRPVGNALLIHPKGEPAEQTMRFVEGLAPDSRNILVVLDLPSHSSLDLEWDAVARFLASRSGNVRLVFQRGRHYEVRDAGQRIADRLGRAVLAPDGASLSTVGGGLFVPTENGAGWLLFRPGRVAQIDSRRFPKPNWEFSVPDRPWRISEKAIAEPLPGGVWVHSSDHQPLSSHRQRLIRVVPCHPDILAVVVGAPGEPEVPLEDVARLWENVLATARPLVRFVHYGPVELPNGRAFGQELADRLEQQIGVYAGLPTAIAPGLSSPDVVGVRSDGWPAWRPFVSELVYFPSGDGESAPPALLGVRAPFPEIREVAPGVYDYAPDSVLEVVQSGLWVRPHEAGADGEEVRRVPARPGNPLILFDRATPWAAERMRALAKDVLWRLDPAVRAAFRLAPADDPEAAVQTKPAEMVRQPERPATARRLAAAGSVDVSESAVPPARRAAGSAGAATPPTPSAPNRARVESPGLTDPFEPATVVESAGPALAPAPDGAAGTDTSALAAAGSANAPATAGDAGAVSKATDTRTDTVTGAEDSGGTPRQDAADPAQGPAPAPKAGRWPGPRDGSWRAASPPPVTEAGAGPAPGSEAGTDAGPEAAKSRPGASDGAASPRPVTGAGPGREASATPKAWAAPWAAPDPAPGAAPAPVPTPGRVRSAAPRVRLESGPPDGPALAPPPAVSPTPAAAPAPAPQGPVQARPQAARQRDSVRVQPVPKSGACAVPPERGLGQERAWVRRALSEQYNAAIGTVSGIMAESPALRGGARGPDEDALTDLVALRLYLTGDSRALDMAVRSATAGPHVPLARCVASGLDRLPSYRGPALLHSVLTSGERAWYGPGRLLTEWAFCTAHSSPGAGPDGVTDILIWSMTARRTNLLDPSAPDRVIFLPGTSFEVLKTVTGDGGRTAVLLRELSKSEISADGRVGVHRTPLDEIAVNSLEQTLRVLAGSAAGGAGAKGPVKYGTAAPPGLLSSAMLPRRGASGRAAQAATRKAPL